MCSHALSQSDVSTARRWVLAGVVALVGVLAYLPQCGYEFVYDDVFIISRNPAVCGGPWSQSFTEPYWPPAFARDPIYRPITTLSLRADYALFGDRSWAYRATNALLHGLCSALVALLAARFWGRGAAGWVAGLLFAAHPLHAEAVALVVGRAELLAAVFSIGLIYRHVGYLSGPRVPSVRHHLIAALLALLALGSKEHAVFALPAIVCLDLWARRAGGGPVRGRINRLAASHYLGLALAAVTFFFVRWLMFGGRTTLPPDHVNAWANPLIGVSSTTRLAVPPALLFLSLRLFVLPVSLCPIWSVGGFDMPLILWRPDVIAGVVLLAAGVMVAVAGLWRRQRVAVPVTLAMLFLIVPCHFVPAANWLFAERWLYLPSAFLLLLVAGVGRLRLAVPLAVVAAVVLFGIGWRYQRCWRSTDDLMQAVVARQPYSYHGLVGRARGLSVRGELAAGQTEVARLVERFPDSPRTWYYQTMLMDRLGRPQDVLKAFDKLARLSAPIPIPIPNDALAARDRARRTVERADPPAR